MINNNLLQVHNKKLQHKICHFVLCLHKGQFHYEDKKQNDIFCAADIEKPYNDNYFFKLANKKLFMWQHLEISSVLLFSWVSGSGQIVETFFNKHIWVRFEPHWHGKIFPIIYCYQNHDVLSLIHAIMVPEQCFVVVIPRFELPFRISTVNKAVSGC